MGFVRAAVVAWEENEVQHPPDLGNISQTQSVTTPFSSCSVFTHGWNVDSNPRHFRDLSNGPLSSREKEVCDLESECKSRTSPVSQADSETELCTHSEDHTQAVLPRFDLNAFDDDNGVNTLSNEDLGTSFASKYIQDSADEPVENVGAPPDDKNEPWVTPGSKDLDAPGFGPEDEEDVNVDSVSSQFETEHASSSNFHKEPFQTRSGDTGSLPNDGVHVYKGTVGPSPLNSSLDLSDSEHLRGDDAFNTGEDSVLHTRPESERVIAHEELGFVGNSEQLDQDHSSEVFALSHGPGVTAQRAEELSLPVCAVVGADTLLGSHVTRSILLARSHHVRALVTSSDAAEFLSEITSGDLSVIETGELELSSSQVPLRGALRGVETVVNCSELRLSEVRTSRVADMMLAAARTLADAIGHPGSSVRRLIHCGTDLAVWDPRVSQPNTVAIEPDLDENDWFSIMDDDRKVSHAEAYGRTAAEMLLWARAAGDRVPYTMCSVISSLVLGPLYSSSQCSAAGPKVRTSESEGHFFCQY